MKITIAHLFYDLLNLYGESGNILALKNALESQENVEVEIKNLSIDNGKLNLEDVDFVYIGTGTKNNQKIALEYLKENTQEIEKYIKANKMFLATGNSIEIFGTHIEDETETQETLGIFDYYTKISTNRIVAECIFKYENIESKILGFENHDGITKNSQSPMFTVEKRYGIEDSLETEGYMNNNFYGSYLLGPLLVRNPELLEKMCKSIILSKDKDFTFKDFDFEIEKQAHDQYLKKYETNKN